MARITVSTVIDAPPGRVWADIEDLASHVEWMADAVAIRFPAESGPDPDPGVGTVFECDTAVGPLRLTDRMEITRWEPGRAMGVRHTGLVTGDGEFHLREVGGATVFVWAETLTFPWWMGGPIGARVGALVLGSIWRGNLRRLRARFVL